MADPLRTTEADFTELSLKEERYNKIYRYTWRTTVYALPQSVWYKLDAICKGRWGYFFIPNSNMDWNADNWYENQTLYITFEEESDLIQAKLSIPIKN